MKPLNKLAITLLSLLCFNQVHAQQEQQFTQYMVNGYLLNPAMGGTEDYVDLKIGYRKQWVGLKSSPRTMYLSGHSTLGKSFGNAHKHNIGEHKYWHGLGGYVYNDQTGPIGRTTYMASYAFNMPLTKKVRISTGAFFGIKNFRFDPSGYQVADDGDFLIERYNIIAPDLSLGTWLYNKSFFVGVSVFQLLNNTLDNSAYTGLEESFNGEKTELNRHFFITAGAKLPLSQNINLVPSFALKALSPAPISLDFNAKVDFDDTYWGGISYRYRDAVSLIAGLVIDYQVEVSYSYDWSHTSLKNASSGSHEIILGYRFKHSKHIDCPSSFW